MLGGLKAKKAGYYNGQEITTYDSEDFIDIIDVLIKIGGGPQSEKEFDMAKKDGVPVMEFDVT